MTHPQYQQQYQQPPAYVPATGDMAMPAPPALRDGAGFGGQVAPKMRHLVGRTIIVEPIGIVTTVFEGRPVDEAKFHLTVVDGGPVRYGDNIDARNPAKNRPNTHEVDVPCRFTGATDIGYGFIQVVRDCMDSGEPGKIGVVEQGTMGNRPFLLARTSVTLSGDERPDGAARFAAATAEFSKIWAAKHGGPALHYPEPRSLVAALQTSTPQVTYAQPAYAPPAPPQPAALPPHIEAWLASLPPEQALAQRQAFIASMATAVPAPAGPGF